MKRESWLNLLFCLVLFMLPVIFNVIFNVAYSFTSQENVNYIDFLKIVFNSIRLYWQKYSNQKVDWHVAAYIHIPT